MWFSDRLNLDSSVDCNTVTLNGLLGVCTAHQKWTATKSQVEFLFDSFQVT